MNVEIEKLLLSSEDYRRFLEAYLCWCQEHKQGFSIKSFCDSMGIKSRSLPKDIIDGRRRLTLKTMPLFKDAIGLKGVASELFEAMFYSQEQDLATGDYKDFENLIPQLKSELSFQHLDQKPSEKEVYRIEEWPTVYAALGDSKGASLKAIQKRTNMTRLELREILRAMENHKWVTQDIHSKRFIACLSHVMLPEQESNQFFKKHFLSLLKKTRNKAERSFSGETSLFQSSVYSIDEDDFPRFKEELSELLHRYIKRSESAKGNKIAHLITSIWIE